MSRSKKITVGLVVDESESMAERKAGTISGYNEFIGGLDSGAKVKTVLFSRTHLHEDSYRDHEGELNEESYRPRGITPLYDAVGHVITQLDGVKGKKMVVILTDGFENASVEFTRDMIRSMIREREADGWNFLYIGAGQDAWAAEQSSRVMGVSAGSSYIYSGTNTGTADTFSSLTGTVALAASGQVTNSNLVRSMKEQEEAGKDA